MTKNLVNFHVSSRKSKVQSFRWKRTEELCLVTLKSNAKFEEKLTLDSENGMRNLVNFNASSGKSEKLHFDVMLLLKVYYARAKIVQRSYVITLKNDAKFEKELTSALKNDMNNLVNFDPTLKSLKTCTLMGSFWLKYVMFEPKSYRGVMCHETEGWCNI